MILAARGGPFKRARMLQNGYPRYKSRPGPLLAAFEPLFAVTPRPASAGIAASRCRLLRTPGKNEGQPLCTSMCSRGITPSLEGSRYGHPWPLAAFPRPCGAKKRRDLVSHARTTTRRMEESFWSAAPCRWTQIRSRLRSFSYPFSRNFSVLYEHYLMFKPIVKRNF